MFGLIILMIAICASSMMTMRLIAPYPVSFVYKMLTAMIIFFMWSAPFLVNTHGREWHGFWFNFYTYTMYFLFISAFLFFVGLLLRDFIWIISYQLIPALSKNFPMLSPFNLKALFWANMGLGLLVFTFSGLALYNGIKVPNVEYLTLFSDKIKSEKTIAVLSDLHLNRTLSLKKLQGIVDKTNALKPDIIVNATGSTPLLPPIKGLHENLDKDNNKVSSILKMMDSIEKYPEDCSNMHIAVVGGGAVGLDVVEFFANRGAKTTIIEMQPQVGKDLDPVTKSQVSEMIEKHHVNVMVNTALQEVCEDHFVVKVNDELQNIDFDLGFVCLGMRNYSPIYSSLCEYYQDRNVDIINIGDSVRARRIIDGVAEGRNILSVLKKRELL